MGEPWQSTVINAPHAAREEQGERGVGDDRSQPCRAEFVHRENRAVYQIALADLRTPERKYAKAP